MIPVAVLCALLAALVPVIPGTSRAQPVSTLVLSPNPAIVGQIVTAFGCGFPASATVATVAVNGLSPSSVVSIASAAGLAGCYDVTFALPTVPPGMSPATVMVTVGGVTDTGTLSVDSAGPGEGTLILSPNPATIGQAVTAYGCGFPPSTGTASVAVNGVGPIVVPAQAAQGSVGCYNVTFTLPPAAAGPAAAIVTVTIFGITQSASVGVTIIPGAATLVASPSSVAAGGLTAVTGSGYTAGETVTLSAFGTSQSVADATGTFTATLTVPADATAGPNEVFAVTPDGLGASTSITVSAVLAPTPTSTSLPTQGPVSPPTPVSTPTLVSSPSGTSPASLPSPSTGPTTTYFAEGYTGTVTTTGKVSFTERLYFFNTTSSTSSVTTTYAVGTSAGKPDSTVTEHDTVAAGATISRLVNADVGNDRIVSATVSGSRGIVAQEVISRAGSGGKVLAGATSLGSADLSTIWYLADGHAGRSMQEYLVLYNPAPVAARAQVYFMPESAPAPAPVLESIPAGSQVTINVGSVYGALAPAGSPVFATEVTSDQPLAVDRVLYWGDGSGSAKYGFSIMPARTQGLLSQALALLPTSGGSQSFVTVFNPGGGGAAHVTLTLLGDTGATLKSVSATIEAQTPYTFAIASVLPGDNGDITGVLTSDSAVVAEASIYYGGSPSAGSAAGLVEQGSGGAQTGARIATASGPGLVRVFNPGMAAARVRVLSSGSPLFDGLVAAGATQEIQLPAAEDAGGLVVTAGASVVSTQVSGGVGSASVLGGNVT